MPIPWSREIVTSPSMTGDRTASPVNSVVDPVHVPESSLFSCLDKGGPGITQSDLLVINKTDLAQAVGADLELMDRDARRMRGEGPTIFAAVKHGDGLEEIVDHILRAHEEALRIE